MTDKAWREMHDEPLARAHAEELIEWADRFVDGTSRPIYVYRMARACQGKPGALRRQLNAARDLRRIVHA